MSLLGEVFNFINRLLIIVPDYLFPPSNAVILVNTTYGPVRGMEKTDGDRNTSFYSFTGIPYAKAPIGQLRFKDPQPPDNWTEPFDATQKCPVPYGLDPFMVSVELNATEDCLRLNVFTKSVNKTSMQPVLVWIYGGGFISGNSGYYGPDFFMQQNVVMVTINYRFGAFGFLSVAGTEFDVPGNAGLKDQRMALIWIRDNVAQFGGDPSNITLLGQSAGAASVHFHMLSPMSKGLFHRAILQSGSAFCPWAQSTTPSAPNEMAKRLALSLGWNERGGTTAMLAHLRQADPDRIVRAQQIRTPLEIQSGIMFPFVPTIESSAANSCFLCDRPETLAVTAWGNQIPMLTGFTSTEGYLMFPFYIGQSRILEAKKPIDNLLPAGVPFRWYYGELLRKMYNVNLPLTLVNVDQIVPLLGDKLIRHGVDMNVMARLNGNGESNISAPTYLYRFSYDSQYQIMMKILMAGKIPMAPTAVHSEELQYLWNMEKFNANQFGTDLRVSTLMIKIWTQFAATGNPIVDEINMLNWQPVVKHSRMPKKCLNFDEETSVMDVPENDRILFWNTLMAKRSRA